MLEKRILWVKKQPSFNIQDLVFIDESGFNTKMTRLYGWGRKSERLKCKAPNGHWKTMTFIAGLRHNRIDAPWVLDGAMNGNAFCVWLEECLLQTLKAGDLVIMDNLSSHKVKQVKEILSSVEAKPLYLPPYSPDFNPIEQVFAKLKSLMRKAERRTYEGLWKHLGKLLDKFPPMECLNYLRNSGYG